jgi:micrococcal nuclease
MRCILLKFSIFLFLLLFVIPQTWALEKATVIRVVDGDTIKVEIKSVKESVRLIGIDTPESTANKKARNDAVRGRQSIESITSMSKESASFVKTFVHKSDTIAIEPDVQPRDKYGRLLAYVYLANGELLNEEIIKAGYASPMTIPPNVRYQDRFLKAYREAREKGKGLWGKGQ